MAIIFAGAAVSYLLVWVYRQKKKLDESYRNLFSMNKRLAENHEQASAQYRECIELLNIRDEEIRRLKSNIDSKKFPTSLLLITEKSMTNITTAISRKR